MSGAQPVGELVRLAVERHVRDLTDGKKRDLEFDEGLAQHALDFYGYCKHSKGEWAGQSFVPSDWQAFVRWSLFGWVNKSTRYRRFRTGYVTVARKNGKSTDAATLGHYGLVADDEPGAEIYTAATKRDQARIVHMEAKRMVQSSPELSAAIECYRDNLSIPYSASKYEPLGADADTHDGLNPHFVLMDEVHAHKKRDQYDVLWTGMGARRQPLMYLITTAGASRESLCYELDNYSDQVLRGILTDDTWFAYVARPDEDDDWADEDTWIKGNPNLGVSVYLENLRNDFAKAKASIASQNAFKRLRLNMWTQQTNRVIDMDQWDACDRPAVIPDKAPVYVGVDLSSKIDITAAVALYFDKDKREYHVHPHFWIPEESIQKRVSRDRVPYDVWCDHGYMTATPGNQVDQDFVRNWIKSLRPAMQVREIGFDPWNATSLAQDLQDKDGFKLIEMRQGFKTLSEPMKSLLGLVADKQVRHGGNPVLRWMADNLEVRRDANDNIAPTKSSTVNRIDGIVAMVLALGRAQLHVERRSPGIFLVGGA